MINDEVFYDILFNFIATITCNNIVKSKLDKCGKWYT